MITNKMFSGAKEEGELSDDEGDDNGNENNYGMNAALKQPHGQQSLSKYDSFINTHHLKSKRDGQSRRMESNSTQRGHKISERSTNRYRQQEPAAKIPAESRPQSKFWDILRSRAPSVHPVTPSLRVRNQAPKWGQENHDDSDSPNDDLVQLEMSKKMIQNQLKYLDEEERKACGKSDKTKMLDSSNEKPIMVNLEDLIVADDEGENDILIDDEKTDDELRKLALATSVRHKSLIVSVTKTGAVEDNSDVAENIIDLVSEEEEEITEKKEKVTEKMSVKNKKVTEKLKLKSKKNAIVKERNENFSSKNQTAGKKKKELKSRILKVSNDKMEKKGKVVNKKSPVRHLLNKGSKVEIDWMEQHRHLRSLAKQDPKLAYEQFLKFFKGDNQKISATGTMKDFKRQMKIPVLSDKLSVQKVTSKKIPETKTKKTVEKKSTQLEDNYEQVAMDIDSDAEADEKLSYQLQLGEDFNHAMLPIQPYAQSEIQYNYFTQPPVLSYNAFPMMRTHPPIPLQPPPPPPPLPPEEKEIISIGSATAQWQYVPSHLSSSELSKNSYVPTSKDELARLLHQFREASSSTTPSAKQDLLPTKSPTSRQRFVFSKESPLPSRGTIDYSSLDDFDSRPKSILNKRLEVYHRDFQAHNYEHDERSEENKLLVSVGKDIDGGRRVQQLSGHNSDYSLSLLRKDEADSQSRKFIYMMDNTDLLEGNEDVKGILSPRYNTSRNIQNSPWSPKLGRSREGLADLSEQAKTGDYFPRKSYSSSHASSRKTWREAGDKSLSPYDVSRSNKRSHRSVSPYDVSNKHDHLSPPSREDRNNSSLDQYEPEVKQKRYSSPPPYIPTRKETSHVSDIQNSPESEEDLSLLRSRLLETVITKRKSKLEDLSSSSSPSAMSPRYPFANSEERAICSDTNDDVMTSPSWHRHQLSDEDVQPPPLLSQLGYTTNKPYSLAILCKLRMQQSRAPKDSADLNTAGLRSSEHSAHENFEKTLVAIDDETSLVATDEPSLVAMDTSEISQESHSEQVASPGSSKELELKKPTITQRLGPEKSSQPSDVFKRLAPHIVGKSVGHKVDSVGITDRSVALQEKSQDLSEAIAQTRLEIREKEKRLLNKNNVFDEAKSLVVKASSNNRQVLTKDISHTVPFKRNYSSLMLPIHPQVVVPLVSSDSEEDQTKDNNDIFIKTQTLGKVTTVTREEKEHAYLKNQEAELNILMKKIFKQQLAVNKLLEKGMKIVKAQKQTEAFKDKLQAQIEKLTEELKIAERIANSYKQQKEKTEKEVQALTKSVVQTKSLFKDKEAEVILLGKKLFGLNFVPRAPKVEPVPKVKTKAESIALEKQKLMEKEKKIQEKLNKLKSVGRNSSSVVKSAVAKAQDLPQDMIKIDQTANNEFVAENRRKSLLIDDNNCNTPNIPLTPNSKSMIMVNDPFHSSKNSSAPKDPDKDIKNFKMPSGTQLKHLRKLQVEKMEKHLKGCTGLSLNQPFSNLFKVSLLQISSSEDKKMMASHLSSPTSVLCTYTSPLLMFKSYRLSSFFRTKENLGFQSLTYSNKLNPHCILCPYDLQGTCNDDTCQQQHPMDYKLSEKELLKDIVSYCPKLVGAMDISNAEEIKKCVDSYVDNFLSNKKGKMTTDELCLWLSSEVNSASGKRHPHMVSLEPRRWKLESKEKTGLSLHLDQKSTNKRVEAINTEKIVDKDAVINEEDIRYFSADGADLLSLEAEILKDKTKTELWQRLAHKKLSDPNKSSEECLNQALNVLARGLEENKQDSLLWYTYLHLYKKHPEAQNFTQFCQTALDLAPSYDLWFLYLSSLHTFTEKDEVCSKILEFLFNADHESSTEDLTLDKIKQSENSSAHLETALIGIIADESIKVTDAESDASNQISLHSIKLESEESSRATETKAVQNQQESKEMLDGKLSHQLLEIIFIKVGLNIQAGKLKTALNFLQSAVGLKTVKELSRKLYRLITMADKLCLWLVYLYVLEWHQLPPQLYSDFNQNPGKLLSKNTITMPWSSKPTLHSSLDTLVRLHKKAFNVWSKGKREPAAMPLYITLAQSLISLLKAHGKTADAIALCRQMLSNDRHLVDIWLCLADLMAASEQRQSVIEVFQEAVETNKYCAKLQFYQNVYLFTQGENDKALLNLEQFVISHFDSTNVNLQLMDPNLLYCQLLKQDDAFSLKMAVVKVDIPCNLHRDIYMWLCFNMLIELQGDTIKTYEMYERILTHAENPDDLLIVWQNYIHFMVRSKNDFKNFKDILYRSLLSMPVKRPVPFSSASSAMWIDYSHTNQLVDTWVSVLPPPFRLDVIEACLGFLPGNVNLLLRAVDLCLELKEFCRGYSLCKMMAYQADKPANGAFWKLAIALAQSEGTQREVEQMFIGCVETMPLAVAGWKDFLLQKVSCENQEAIELLLKHCDQLGLNIQGFVSTISAP